MIIIYIQSQKTKFSYFLSFLEDVLIPMKVYSVCNSFNSQVLKQNLQFKPRCSCLSWHVYLWFSVAYILLLSVKITHTMFV